jgi:HPt (histidine-containing phosphotransfer) domain-containing protein
VAAFESSFALNLDQLRDVTLGDPELMREIVATLVEDTSTQLAQLQNAVAKSDARECVRLAHYSKGACANIGADSLANLLQGVEHAAAKGEFDRCRSSLSALAAELQQLREQAATL